jgi:hypothetical protein
MLGVRWDRDRSYTAGRGDEMSKLRGYKITGMIFDEASGIDSRALR